MINRGRRGGESEERSREGDRGWGFSFGSTQPQSCIMHLLRNSYTMEAKFQILFSAFTILISCQEDQEDQMIADEDIYHT